jgi:hypothetical protein
LFVVFIFIGRALHADRAAKGRPIRIPLSSTGLGLSLKTKIISLPTDWGLNQQIDNNRISQ